MRLAALAIVLGWVPAALGETVEEERDRVQERLEQERAAFAALREQKDQALEVLDGVERMARTSARAVAALEARSKALSAQVALAERVEAVSRAAFQRQVQRLSPRLLVMYRLSRRDRLGLLLSASDFAGMVRRSRAMGMLVRRDVELLEETAAAARYQRHAARQLERMRASAQTQLSALTLEAALAAQRKAAFDDLLALIQAESNRSSRVIRDLEHAEAQLSAMVKEMRTELPTSGFRAEKGRLPYPTRGIIEAGFGRVVNPKFNTVTVRKGLDFRAGLGTPVIAIAPGTVVYASWLKGYGNLVIIDHGDGYHTLMAHLATMLVEPGNQVEAGEEIGAVGDTGSLKGPYLYFEIRHRGQAIDPGPWLNESVEP